MRSLVSSAVFAMAVAALLLAVNPNLFSACPNQKPLTQGCPQPPTVVSCKGLTPAPGKQCSNYTGQIIENGDFGCQDNGTNKTQCLDAKMDPQGTNLILCYKEYTCRPFIMGGACDWDLATAVSHNRLKKILVNCPGS